MKLSAARIVLGILYRLSAVVCLSVPAAAMAQSSAREPAFRDNYYDVAIASRNAWIVGYYGTILHSADDGATWLLQDSPTREALFRIVFAENDMGWVAGSYGIILHTRDLGRTWHKQETGTNEHLFGLHFLNHKLGWAVGSRGVVLRTENGGAAWMNASIGEDIILNDVHFTDANQGWAVGEFGRIYHSKDGGRSWTKQKSPIEVSFVSGETRNLFRLLFVDQSRAWAFGLDGAILKTRGGERWELARADGNGQPAAQRHHLFSAASFGDRIWAVGERGTVLMSKLGADDWKPAGIKISPVSLNGIAFSADGLGLVVGNRGFILRSQSGGSSWEQIGIRADGPGRGVSQRR